MNDIFESQVKNRNDLLVFEKVLKICNFLRILPLEDYTNNRQKWLFLQIFWFLMYFIEVYLIIMPFVKISSSSSVGKILTNLYFFTTYLYIVVCMIESSRKQKKMKQFLKKIQIIDIYLRSEHSTSTESSNFYLKIGLSFFIPLLSWINKSLFFHYSTTYTNHLNVLPYFALKMDFTKFLPVLVIYLLENILTVRYTIFGKFLKNSIATFSSSRDQNVTMQTLRKIIFLLKTSVKDINEILGFPILLILIHGFVALLNALTIVLSVNSSRNFFNILSLCLVSSVSNKV